MGFDQRLIGIEASSTGAFIKLDHHQLKTLWISRKGHLPGTNIFSFRVTSHLMELQRLLRWLKTTSAYLYNDSDLLTNKLCASSHSIVIRWWTFYLVTCRQKLIFFIKITFFEFYFIYAYCCALEKMNNMESGIFCVDLKPLSKNLDLPVLILTWFFRAYASS